MKYEINKFEFTAQDSKLKLTDDLQKEFIRRALLKIELIEIKGISSPSDIVIELKCEGFTTLTTPIKLYKYRTRFLYQNETFLLDTKELSEFQLKLEGSSIDINIYSEDEKEFSLKLYYTTYFPKEIPS